MFPGCHSTSRKLRLTSRFRTNESGSKARRPSDVRVPAMPLLGWAFREPWGQVRAPHVPSCCPPPPALNTQGPALHGGARFCNWPCHPGPRGLFPPWGPRGGDVPSLGFLCLPPGADLVTDYPRYSFLESSSLGDSFSRSPTSSHRKKPWTGTPA